jgi:hypothetical protein
MPTTPSPALNWGGRHRATQGGHRLENKRRFSIKEINITVRVTQRNKLDSSIFLRPDHLFAVFYHPEY